MRHISLNRKEFSMTDEEFVDDLIAKGEAARLKDWELCHPGLPTALLEKIDAFLKSKNEWYGNNAHQTGA
jgi:hypothetical protein